ncbi:hypothetical protein EGT67_10160 [Prescottella agglutinans]|uniref:DUF6199 domain-containing protein n=1 Tax=Prescottella agglutinans TaxID=1644129 RepID=A0A3S3EAY3_9NOCA|nr:hypothetical protein [Prescottella agglutinans]RVW09805.1 hypothetical protein EGT67_10160 [Prescottella agglutinans]
MTAVVVFVAISVLVLGLGTWALLSPEGMWKATKGWQYADPDANRPSDAALGVNAFSLLVVGFVMGGGGLWYYYAERDARALENERSAAAEVARERSLLPIRGYTVSPEGTVVVEYQEGSGFRWPNCRPEETVPYSNASEIAVEVRLDTPDRRVNWGCDRETYLTARDIPGRNVAPQPPGPKFGQYDTRRPAGTATVVTTSPIVDGAGVTVTPSGERNVVPRL